jgi:putative PEP-CTERM system histidine kinase
MLLTRSGSRFQSIWLTIAASVSALWGFVLAYGGATALGSTYAVFVAEILHDGFWLLFLSMLLSGAIGQNRFLAVRFGGLACTFLIFVIGSWANSGVPVGPFLPELDRTLFYGSVLTSLFAFVGLEQIYRNARLSQRKGLKYLCLGVGAIFAYDIVLYSNAILSEEVSALLWNARGLTVLMCVPLIGVAVVRGSSWLGGIFMSRHVIFYTTMMFFAVIYMIVVGISGYYIREFGGEWGAVAQLTVFVAALLTLAGLLISDQTRSGLRVYITKHFFESKYEYREEWLRLIDTLTGSDGGLPLRKRAIKSLAQILDAPSGMLWMRLLGRRDYQCVSGWNAQCAQSKIDEDHSIVSFLKETGWVIDLREYTGNRDRYKLLQVDDELPGRAETAIVVPLLNDGQLLGFVFLSEPRTSESLNYEDYDLLKTAGKQIASYLSQELSTEQLAESRQFEAFSRLTAYLMHDLKNLIAQQSLVVENAEKHKDNPEFIDDAMATIKGGVNRLRRVIEHIQQRSASQPVERTELGKLILQAVSQCSDRQPVPKVAIDDQQVWVRADKERLLMAVYHVLRNAQEATPPDGQVSIELSESDPNCAIVVSDTGDGMEESFIRDRLFKPFDSTKGTQGMGIGAYQMRETIRSMGGDVAVSSDLHAGTTVTITLKVAGT